MKNKRAELTTQQIVVLIVLVASFAVLLFFLFRLNLGEETDKEICHNSVVTRGNAIIPTDSVPLNCKRSYVCLTKDGSCEKMTSPEIKEVESKEEVYQVLADELADCWWMFGEGKVDYVGKDYFSKTHYCSFCSQLVFDDSVKDIFNKDFFSQEDFYKYLSENEVSKGVSYHSYLYGFEFEEASLGEGIYKNYSLDKPYWVLMGSISDISDWTKYGFGTVAVAGAIIASPLISFAGSIAIGTGLFVVGAGGASYYVAPVVEGESGLKYTRPTLVEINSDEFKSLNCESINTLS